MFCPNCYNTVILDRIIMTSDCMLFKGLCEITSVNLLQLYLIGTLCCILGFHALWESAAWCCCMPPGSIHLAGVEDSECTAPLLNRGVSLAIRNVLLKFV